MKSTWLLENNSEKPVRRAEFRRKLRGVTKGYPETLRPQLLTHHAHLVTGRDEILENLPIWQLVVSFRGPLRKSAPASQNIFR